MLITATLGRVNYSSYFVKFYIASMIVRISKTDDCAGYKKLYNSEPIPVSSEETFEI